MSVLRIGFTAVTIALLATPGLAAHHEKGEAEAAPTDEKAATEEATDLPEWDQTRVAELARQLATTMTEARRDTMRMPTMGDGSGSQAAQQFLDQLRRLETACRQLAGRLESGATRDETMGNARRIGTLLRDAQETNRRLMNDQNQLKVFDELVRVLDEISPYYGTKTPLLPNPQNR